MAASLSAVCPRTRIVLTSAGMDQRSGRMLATSAAVAFVPKQELGVTDLGALFAASAPSGAARPAGT